MQIFPSLGILQYIYSTNDLSACIRLQLQRKFPNLRCCSHACNVSGCLTSDNMEAKAIHSRYADKISIQPNWGSPYGVEILQRLKVPVNEQAHMATPNWRTPVLLKERLVAFRLFLGRGAAFSEIILVKTEFPSIREHLPTVAAKHLHLHWLVAITVFIETSRWSSVMEHKLHYRQDNQA